MVTYSLPTYNQQLCSSVLHPIQTLYSGSYKAGWSRVARPYFRAGPLSPGAYTESDNAPARKST